ELPFARLLRQVAAELVEELRALRLLAGRRARGAALAAARPGEHADDLVADLLRVRVEVEQDACSNPLVLADEPEQDVLGADVVVLERPRLVLRENDALASPLCESLEHSKPLFRLAVSLTGRRTPMSLIRGAHGTPVGRGRAPPGSRNGSLPGEDEPGREEAREGRNGCDRRREQRQDRLADHGQAERGHAPHGLILSGRPPP